MKNQNDNINFQVSLGGLNEIKELVVDTGPSKHVLYELKAVVFYHLSFLLLLITCFLPVLNN